jgi:hypothetical protein
VNIIVGSTSFSLAYFAVLAVLLGGYSIPPARGKGHFVPVDSQRRFGLANLLRQSLDEYIAETSRTNAAG